MKLNDIYRAVAIKLGLDESDVREAYNLYWNFYRKCIESLPLKEDLTEEEFSKLRTSFNISYIGKIYCTYDRYLRIKKRLKYVKDDKDKKMHSSPQPCDSHC